MKSFIAVDNIFDKTETTRHPPTQFTVSLWALLRQLCWNVGTEDVSGWGVRLENV